MLESAEFLLSLVMCLAYIAVPVGAVGAICYFLGKGQNRNLDA